MSNHTEIPMTERLAGNVGVMCELCETKQCGNVISPYIL